MGTAGTGTRRVRRCGRQDVIITRVRTRALANVSAEISAQCATFALLAWLKGAQKQIHRHRQLRTTRTTTHGCKRMLRDLHPRGHTDICVPIMTVCGLRRSSRALCRTASGCELCRSGSRCSHMIHETVADTDNIHFASGTKHSSGYFCLAYTLVQPGLSVAGVVFFESLHRQWSVSMCECPPGISYIQQPLDAFVHVQSVTSISVCAHEVRGETYSCGPYEMQGAQMQMGQMEQEFDADAYRMYLNLRRNFVYENGCIATWCRPPLVYAVVLTGPCTGVAQAHADSTKRRTFHVFEGVACCYAPSQRRDSTTFKNAAEGSWRAPQIARSPRGLPSALRWQSSKVADIAVRNAKQTVQSTFGSRRLHRFNVDAVSRFRSSRRLHRLKVDAVSRALSKRSRAIQAAPATPVLCASKAEMLLTAQLQRHFLEKRLEEIRLQNKERKKRLRKERFLANQAPEHSTTVASGKSSEHTHTHTSIHTYIRIWMMPALRRATVVEGVGCLRRPPETNSASTYGPRNHPEAAVLKQVGVGTGKGYPLMYSAVSKDSQLRTTGCFRFSLCTTLAGASAQRVYRSLGSSPGSFT
ncbi:unnamed protein product [Rangifer tarandus platyrhynchus]|uniref:Uncharacterized protein n=1 Tax=Rangifer tarandus platyrhynchus TaxID=3082113 RepID=A0ABN8XJR8_RANTA|nr:unnamed protein product [Rangifer tarandus platyrhynchus]